MEAHNLCTAAKTAVVELRMRGLAPLQTEEGIDEDVKPLRRHPGSHVAEDGARAVGRIVEISEAGRAPKNDPALFALALAAASDLAHSAVLVPSFFTAALATKSAAWT